VDHRSAAGRRARAVHQQQFYDYYIHSESVSHKPDNDDTLMRSARHYMKILEMLEAINQRYPDKVRHIAACRWQIAKEGWGSSIPSTA
jgi:hypothetical protein